MADIELEVGEFVQHDVYGKVELRGFRTVSDELFIDEIERDDETELDISTTVVNDVVEFVDENGSEHTEPLNWFYEHADI